MERKNVLRKHCQWIQRSKRILILIQKGWTKVNILITQRVCLPTMMTMNYCKFWTRSPQSVHHGNKTMARQRNRCCISKRPGVCRIMSYDYYIAVSARERSSKLPNSWLAKLANSSLRRMESTPYHIQLRVINAFLSKTRKQMHYVH